MPIGQIIFLIILGVIIVAFISFITRKSLDISRLEDKVFETTKKDKNEVIRNDEDVFSPHHSETIEDNDLVRLRENLIQLSYSLREIDELMCCSFQRQLENMDDRICLYIAGYRPSFNKCTEISDRYSEWIEDVLKPVIEQKYGRFQESEISDKARKFREAAERLKDKMNKITQLS
jgi:hypothetical protein